MPEEFKVELNMDHFKVKDMKRIFSWPEMTDDERIALLNEATNIDLSEQPLYVFWQVAEAFWAEIGRMRDPTGRLKDGTEKN